MRATGARARGCRRRFALRFVAPVANAVLLARVEIALLVAPLIVFDAAGGKRRCSHQDQRDAGRPFARARQHAAECAWGTRERQATGGSESWASSVGWPARTES